MARLLLWHVSRQAVARVPSLPIDDSIRRRVYQDLPQLHSMKISMGAGSYHFDRAAKIATLRRFPAGIIRRSAVLLPARVIFCEPAISGICHLRPEGPEAMFLHAHCADSPQQGAGRAAGGPALVLSHGPSMELQPEVRAILVHAWFHDPAAARVYPHLEGSIDRTSTMEG